MPTDPTSTSTTNPPENTPPPATAEPAPKPKRQSPSPINKKYLVEIELIQNLVSQAQKPDRTAALTAGEWDPARVTALAAQGAALEQAGLAAVGRTQARGMDTEEEAEARRQILIALSPIRTGAKRKYRNVPDAAAGRATYFVNKETNVSLERLLFIAGAVLQKLTAPPPAATPEDTLPGVTPAVLTALRDTRAAYVTSNADQEATNSAKNQAHVTVTQAYAAAHSARLDLQLAADQIWTFHDPANSAIRRDFQIPPDRPAVE